MRGSRVIEGAVAALVICAMLPALLVATMLLAPLAVVALVPLGMGGEPCMACGFKGGPHAPKPMRQQLAAWLVAPWPFAWEGAGYQRGQVRHVKMWIRVHASHMPASLHS